MWIMTHAITHILSLMQHSNTIIKRTFSRCLFLCLTEFIYFCNVIPLCDDKR